MIQTKLHKHFSDHWDGRIKPEEMRLLDWKPQYVKNFWVW